MFVPGHVLCNITPHTSLLSVARDGPCSCDGDSKCTRIVFVADSRDQWLIISQHQRCVDGETPQLRTEQHPRSSTLTAEQHLTIRNRLMTRG